MFSSHVASVISLPSRPRCNRQTRGSRQRYYKPKRRSGIMRLTVVIVVVLLYVTSGVETRSVRETCNRLVEPPTCNNYCNDVLYYQSPRSGQCELCIECPAGQQPNHPDPCAAQAKNESVTCIGCDVNFFSNQKDQHHCQPCQVCVNRLIAEECNPTSDRVCGDCKPGFFSKTYDDVDYCVLCTKARTDEDREKCQTTTVDPTTTPMPITMTMPMTTMPTTTKSKSPLPAPKITVVNTDGVNQPATVAPHKNSGNKIEDEVQMHKGDKKKLKEHTIIQLLIVGCVFFVFICGICAFAFVHIKRNSGSRRSSTDSDRSKVSYTKAPGVDNSDILQGGDSKITIMKPASSITSLNDKGVPITSTNLKVNGVKKGIPTKEIHIVSNMTADRMEIQRSPDDGKVGSTLTESEISSTSEGSSTDILSHVGNQLIIASRPQAAVNKMQNLETKPKRRLQRALSVPEIRVTGNQLIELMKEHAHCLGSPRPIGSDISSGDESDQGLTALPEDAILPQKSRRKSVSSLAVPVKKPPSRVRRKSLSATVGPLLTDGGSFSSGTSKDYFPNDSQHPSSTSCIINNNNVFSAARSLHSNQTPPEQRKKRKLRRQLSHENQAMDTSCSDNGELANKNTQMCQRSKGPVAQPSQVDDPVPYRASYHTVYSQYQYQHEEQQPYGFNQTQQLPPQQTANPSPPSLTLPQPPTAALPASTSRSSATPVRAPPSGTTPTGSVVHIYQGTVIQSVNGNNLNISVGDNNNLIQQGNQRGDCGGTGGASGFQPIPRTPEPVDCTEQDEELVKCEFSSSTSDGSS